jgi:Uma2 family endonuclease
MSTATPLFPPETLPPYPVMRFTVEEYQQLVSIGVIDEDDNVELLEGWIVPKMGKNPPHECSVNLVETTVRRHLPIGWIVRVQSSITTDDSEPKPDGAVVRGTPRDYMTAHPTPKSVGLVIEVAESSLQRDRRKATIYARAKIPTYWIVNLVDDVLEVCTQPVGEGAAARFAERREYRRGESVPLILDGATVADVPVDEVLP